MQVENTFQGNDCHFLPSLSHFGHPWLLCLLCVCVRACVRTCARACVRERESTAHYKGIFHFHYLLSNNFCITKNKNLGHSVNTLPEPKLVNMTLVINNNGKPYIFLSLFTFTNDATVRLNEQPNAVPVSGCNDSRLMSTACKRQLPARGSPFS